MDEWNPTEKKKKERMKFLERRKQGIKDKWALNEQKI